MVIDWIFQITKPQEVWFQRYYWALNSFDAASEGRLECGYGRGIRWLYLGQSARVYIFILFQTSFDTVKYSIVFIGPKQRLTRLLPILTPPVPDARSNLLPYTTNCGIGTSRFSGGYSNVSLIYITQNFSPLFLEFYQWIRHWLVPSGGLWPVFKDLEPL